MARKVQITVGVDTAVQEELAFQAHAERRSVSFVAERALLRGLSLAVSPDRGPVSELEQRAEAEQRSLAGQP